MEIGFSVVESSSFYCNCGDGDSFNMAGISILSSISNTILRLFILFKFCSSKILHFLRNSLNSFDQVLQFYYQRGCLYRLRALGETHDMDITIEGFHRWMFRKNSISLSILPSFFCDLGGLSFLVPFLLVGYLFQLYNAYTLWQLAYLPSTHEWQVMVLAMIFFFIFLGNILTTLSVLRDKFRDKTQTSLLKQKYQSFKTFLSTNYHRRSRSFHQFGHRPMKEHNHHRKSSKED